MVIYTRRRVQLPAIRAHIILIITYYTTESVLVSAGRTTAGVHFLLRFVVAVRFGF